MYTGPVNLVQQSCLNNSSGKLNVVNKSLSAHFIFNCSAPIRLQLRIFLDIQFLIPRLTPFQAGERITALALKSFSRIDGLIINHGTLGKVKRIAESSASEWQSVFDINFFSAISLVCNPSFRKPHRVIFILKF